MNHVSRGLLLDVGAAALVLAIAGAVSTGGVRPDKFGDMDFHLEAKTFSRSLRGLPTDRALKIAKAPGPTLYYTIPYLTLSSSATEDSYWRTAVLWNLAWTCVAAALLRRIGEVLSRHGGWLALLFAFFPPLPVYYDFGVLAEPPAFLGAVLFAYGWSQWLTETGPARPSSAWLVSWLGLAFLILCRPNAVLILPIGLVVCWFAWRSKGDGRRRGVLVLAGLAIPVASIFVSIVYVRMLGGGWQEGNLTHIMLQGRFQYRTEPWDWRYWQKKYREGSRDHAAWSELQKRFSGEAKDRGIASRSLEAEWIANDVLAHPLLSLRMMGTRALAVNVESIGSVRMREFHLGRFKGPAGFYAFHLLLNLPHIAVTILALFFLLRERRAEWRYWALWAPWVALFVFTALTYVEPRYLFPSRPGMAVLGACQFIHLWRRSDSRTLPRPASDVRR